MATSLLFRRAATTAVLAGCATVALAFGGSVLTTGGLASCISTDSYVYTAQKYDPTNDCVNAYAAFEVVNGSGASARCPRVCLMVGADLYVSTLCPPLPDIASAVDSDAGACIAALAAAASGGTCDMPVATEGGTDDGGADGGDEDANADAEAPDAEGVDAADAAAIKDAADAG
jgi:hypothetical protein